MGAMPRLSAFYGIVIYMYRPDHPPPHFLAQYGEHVAQIDLASLEVLNGSLPGRALRLFLLRGTLGEPLKDLDYFRQVSVDHDARTIVWPNGLDPGPELLHAGQESTDALERNRTAA
jgi:Domain of unknown function (DUF4160)/Protein of unknown function (DUF2442)